MQEQVANVTAEHINAVISRDSQVFQSVLGLEACLCPCTEVICLSKISNNKIDTRYIELCNRIHDPYGGIVGRVRCGWFVFKNWCNCQSIPVVGHARGSIVRE